MGQLPPLVDGVLFRMLNKDMNQLTKDDLKQVLKEVGVVTKDDLKQTLKDSGVITSG